MNIISDMKNLNAIKGQPLHINQFSEIFPRAFFYELSGTADNNILKQNPTHIISYLREKTPTPNEENIYIIGKTKLNEDLTCIENALKTNEQLNNEFTIINMDSNSHLAPKLNWWEINYKKLKYINIIPFIHVNNLEKHMHIEGDRTCINYDAYSHILQINLKAKPEEIYNAQEDIKSLESIWCSMTNQRLSNTKGNIHKSYHGTVSK